MEQDFDLVVNEVQYRVVTPEKERLSQVFIRLTNSLCEVIKGIYYFPQEQLTTLSHVRNLVAQLYEGLQVDQHQLQKERQLLAKLERLKKDLEPLEQVRSRQGLVNHSKSHEIFIRRKMKKWQRKLTSK